MNPEKIYINNGRKTKLVATIVIALVCVMIIGVTSYAFFNYTKIGENNVISTSAVDFEFMDNNSNINIGNAFPTDIAELDVSHEATFNIASRTTISNGIRYRVYATYGDDEAEKTRLLDNVMSVEFIPPSDGDGFTTMINNYKTPKSLSFVNGKALISTGLVENVSDLITKTYTVRMWVDSNKTYVSSTTKRATNAEGNPSLADSTVGNVIAARYIRNDSNLVEAVLYPADSEQDGKIIYTTNEFKNSYYSIKIMVEAQNAIGGEEEIYFDANGGTIDSDLKKVTVGVSYGTLPIPSREGYTFLGWNGKNMFNKDDIDNGQFIDSSTGDISSTPGANNLDDLASTNLISVEPNTTYIKSGNIGSSTQDCFDINEEFISVGNVASEASFTTPSNCYYVKFNLNRTNSPYNDVQLEKGTSITTYEPYYVTNSTLVTQQKDHVLTAIWQKNNS